MFRVLGRAGSSWCFTALEHRVFSGPQSAGAPLHSEHCVFSCPQSAGAPLHSEHRVFSCPQSAGAPLHSEHCVFSCPQSAGAPRHSEHCVFSCPQSCWVVLVLHCTQSIVCFLILSRAVKFVATDQALLVIQGLNCSHGGPLWHD